MKKILVYPYYNNPYQSLLYSEIMKDQDISIRYLRSMKYDGILLLLLLPMMILRERIHGSTIFHLHWVAFNTPTRNNVMQIISFCYTICMILYIKVLGFRLVWTIHNIVPHEKITTDDLSITRLLCRVADQKIVHASETIRELQRLGCSLKHITEIPHGNYSGYYTNTVTKATARNFLRIPRQTFVYLLFGEMKTYKGIEEVMHAFSQIQAKHNNVLLLCAGKVYDKELYEIIHRYQDLLTNNILLYIRHIHDDEVQYFMAASDVVVYAFKKITTSGSVLLALSFGKAVIYPLLGALKDIPKNVGFSYEPGNKDGLFHAMKYALEEVDKKTFLQREKHAYQYATSLSWDEIAQQTIAVYKSLF